MPIQVGCGSWSDVAYTGLLYPPGLSSQERLHHYGKHFTGVEVNSSYYATPKRETVAQWCQLTPDGFIFDLKLHRAVSQNPAKTATEGSLLDHLLHGIEPLIETKKMGTLLLVLPPTFGPEKHSLTELDQLVAKVRPLTLAVELRHRDWVEAKLRDQTLSYFKAHEIIWVSTDMPKLKAPSILPILDEVTNPKLAYLRLHGRNPKYLEAASAAERHDYKYSEKELQGIVRRIRALQSQAEQVRVVANNHAKDFAPQAALAIKRLLKLD